MAAAWLAPFGLRLAPPSRLAPFYARTLWAELRQRWAGREQCQPTLSLSGLRFLFVYALGFSNRRQQLMFSSRPAQSQEALLERYADWLRRQAAAEKEGEGAAEQEGKSAAAAPRSAQG